MTTDYSYLCCTSSKSAPLQWKNPLVGETQEYSVSDCCAILIEYQNDSSPNIHPPESVKIKHWWNRKWQVCLDYYLASPAPQITAVKSTFAACPPIDIALPKQRPEEQLSLVESLLERKTHRKFQDFPLALDIFAALLAELTDELFAGIWRYYLILFNVEGVYPGIYRYHPHAQGLSLIKEGLFREEAVKLLCGMSASLTASFLVVLSIDIQEAMQSFPYSRALREIYIDSGRLAQKLLLKGMQYHVGGLPSPAMRDTPMCTFLNLDLNQCIPLYTLTMGIIPKRDL